MAAPQLTIAQQGQGVISADQANTYNQTCDNMAQLRAFTGTQGIQVFVRGFSSPNDGGQGDFYWNASGTTPDDNGVTTVVPNAAGSGEWTRIPPGLLGSSLTLLGNLTVDGNFVTNGNATVGENLLVDGTLTVDGATSLATATATPPTVGSANSSVATTSVLGNWQKALGISTTTTLTSANFGQLIEASGSGVTITMPASVTGALIGFFNTGSSVVTLSATNFNVMGVGSLTTYPLAVGQTIIFVGDGTSWSWVGGSGFAVAQSWTSVTGSRALGTTYTNTSGKPIQVSISINCPSIANYTLVITVSGVAAFTAGAGVSSGQTVYLAGTVVVPPGGTYVAAQTNSTGSAASLNTWSELR